MWHFFRVWRERRRERQAPARSGRRHARSASIRVVGWEHQRIHPSRLLLQRDVTEKEHHAGICQVGQAFDFIYGRGCDPELDWSGLCNALGVADADALVADPAVKQRLIANTEQAADAGVFGVPTFVVRGELFWGGDTIAWLNAFVDDPGMFERGEISRAAEIEFGAHRRD